MKQNVRAAQTMKKLRRASAAALVSLLLEESGVNVSLEMVWKFGIAPY